MTTPAFTIVAEEPAHGPAIDQLQEQAFGPGRFTRTAYRLRENAASVPALNFTAWRDDQLAGSIRFWKMQLGASPGLLLGPLVVHARYKDEGCGFVLMQTALERARGGPFQWVILVGDKPYYARLGFDTITPGQIILPGPVDPARLLYLELAPGIMTKIRGPVTGVNS